MSAERSRLRGPGVRLLNIAMALIAFVLEKVLVRQGASEAPHGGSNRGK